MKLLVCGSRQLDQNCYALVAQTIEQYFSEVTLIIHGGARGGDQIAHRYAIHRKLPEIVIRPDYQQYAPHLAPIMRNSQLVQEADAVLALYAGQKTNGTLNTIQKALAAGKYLVELNVLSGTTHVYPRQQTLWSL